jgi:hypothetical protein
MTDSELLARRLVATFPLLQPVLDEHLNDMEGKLLPYLLFADVARWTQANVEKERHGVRGMVEWFECEFATAKAPERDLISLGFVEAIPYTPEGDPLLDLLDPLLREEAEVLGLFNPVLPY